MKWYAILAVLAPVLWQAALPAAATPGRFSDFSGSSVETSARDSATGTLREVISTEGTNSGSSFSYSGPDRASRSASGSTKGSSAGTGGPTSSAGSTTLQQEPYIDPNTGMLVQILTNFIPNAGPAGNPAAAAPVVTVPPVLLAREAAATLQLPVQTVRVGPDPSLNRWNMLAVGYPLWLWREGTGTINESVELSGASLSMTATYGSTTYDMGDGNSVACSESTPWVAGAQPAGSPSPTCGHTYTRPGTYTITATHTWNLSWSGLGESGSFPLTNVSSTTIEVGELASVVVGR